MCKIFAMTNMENVRLTQRFVGVVRDQVCKSSDRDGFGYSVMGQDGSIGGERSIRPLSFRALTEGMGQNQVHKLPIALKSNNSFGQVDRVTPKAFMAHGRLSTNDVCIENTHPFTNGEISLIHNGVVQDSSGQTKDSLVTTCDTEILLRLWEKGGMKAIEDSATGYYAVVVMDKKGRLHVARDDRAMLYMSYIRTVNSFMIATTMDIIKGVCKAMKWKHDQPEEMLPNNYGVFDGNEIVAHRKIEPLGGVMSSQAAAAFGWNTSDYAAWRNQWQETDATSEPVPNYRSEVDYDDDYYSGRHYSQAVQPVDRGDLPAESVTAQDDGPDLVDENNEPPSEVMDCVDMIEGSAISRRLLA